MSQTLVASAEPIAALKHDLKAADAVWIAVALLHRENPDRLKFSTEEVFDQVKQKNLTYRSDATVVQHIRQHCVANREPNGGRLRMLYALGRGDRRLYRSTDKALDGRDGPTHPDWEMLPQQYADLQQWYETDWDSLDDDPLSALIGKGKHLWQHESGDTFLARLRSNWGGFE